MPKLAYRCCSQQWLVHRKHEAIQRKLGDAHPSCGSGAVDRNRLGGRAADLLCAPRADLFDEIGCHRKGDAEVSVTVHAHVVGDACLCPRCHHVA